MISFSDYYPFGSIMPMRSSSLDKYRYGFNGQEKDDALSGMGNHVDFGNRFYDPRLGRWHSIDPLSKLFPSESNYSFGFNNPVFYIDLEGNSPFPGDPIIVKTTPEIVSSNDLEQMKKLIEEANKILKSQPPPLPDPSLPPVMRINPILKTITLVESTFPDWSDNGIRNRYYKHYLDLQIRRKGMYSWQWTSRIDDDIAETMQLLMKLETTVMDENGEIEIFTTDPSRLSDAYLSRVRERILAGKARPTDLAYQEEAFKRIALKKLTVIDRGITILCIGELNDGRIFAVSAVKIENGKTLTLKVDWPGEDGSYKDHSQKNMIGTKNMIRMIQDISSWACGQGYESVTFVGFRDERSSSAKPGKTTTITIKLPQGCGK